MRGCGKRKARGDERRWGAREAVGRERGVGVRERCWGAREVLGRRRRERGGSKGEVRAKGGVGCGVWEWEHKAGG